MSKTATDMRTFVQALSPRAFAGLMYELYTAHFEPCTASEFNAYAFAFHNAVIASGSPELEIFQMDALDDLFCDLSASQCIDRVEDDFNIADPFFCIEQTTGCYQSNPDITRLDAWQRAQSMIRGRLQELADYPDALASIRQELSDTLYQPLALAAMSLIHERIPVTYATPQELAACCNGYADAMDLYN